jgi:deoxyribonuclease-4
VRGAALRYGPSGLPAGPPAEAVAWLRQQGFGACEVSFARGYPKLPVLEELRAAAAEGDVLLSVHAPLFAFPGNTDAAKRKQAASNMDHTAGLAQQLGADVVVIHPGFLLGRERDRAIAEVVEHLGEIGERLEAKGRLVPFGVEVMGRVRELGSLEDVVEIARAVAWVRPVVDFAHLQATSDGALREPDDFRAVLDTAAGALGTGERLHVHFSDIRYANRNEDRHVAYGTGSLRAEPLAAALASFDRPVTVISESPDLGSTLEIGRLLGAL